MKRLSLVLGCLYGLSVAPVFSTDSIQGNAEHSSQSFSFPILAHAFYEPKSFFFVGALENVVDNSFAIAAATHASKNTFIPLAPPTVTLNNQKDQENPLFGAGIKLLCLCGDRPVATTLNDDSSLYLFFDYSKVASIQLLSAQGVADATGAAGAHIIGLTSTNNGVNEGGAEAGVFAAVTKTGGIFGPVGSGVALAVLKTAQIKEKNNTITTTTFNFVNAADGGDGNKAAPLDSTSSALKIGADLTSIVSPSIALHYDPILSKLYAGVQSVVGGAGGSDGAKSVAIGAVFNKVLSFGGIAPDAAISTDSIIAATGSLATVSAHHLRTMHTSTWLSYLVVNGGLGDADATRRNVYAMPLINFPGSKKRGFLAKKTAIPFDEYSRGTPKRFLGRFINEEPTAPGDLYVQTDLPAMVGRGEAPGSITDMVVRGDAVYISTVNADTEQPGIFYSQAIFDTYGRIKAWTTWQRAGGYAQPTFGMALDRHDGSFWYMPGAFVDQVFTVARTTWGVPNLSIASTINTFFPRERGGARGLTDFRPTNDAFTQVAGERLSVLTASGFDQLVLAQSGADNGAGIFGPYMNFLEGYVSKNGALSGLVTPTNYLALSGGALSSLGPIITSTLVTDPVSTMSWLVVASARGVAVLAREDGTSWTGGLQQGFVGLTSDMKFVLKGDYKNIRRVFADGPYLYIVTFDRVDRIQATAGAFSTQGALGAVTVAQRDHDQLVKSGPFFDIVVCDAFALLASAQGLFRVGNQASIRTATSPQDVAWTPVVLPESTGGAHAFQVISSSSVNPYDLHNANVYVLAAEVANDKAWLYRFVVADYTQVTDETILLFPDYYLASPKTFFLDFGDYRNGMVADGGVIYSTRSAYASAQPFVQMVPQGTKSGVPRAMDAAKIVDAQAGYHAVGRMMRSAGDGSWMITGDFGIKTNQ